MELLVIRHAIAEDREGFAATGQDDSLRRLTPEGVRKMRRTAAGLHRVVPSIDLLVSSPFTRARETAEIVRHEFELDRVETADALVPGTELSGTVGWLADQREDVVAVVGHEPHLSRLVSYLACGIDRSAVELKKGGACMIEFEGRPAVGEGLLRWLLTPGTLRDLAG